MSLLNKASILTTPTAYENGKILSVKPSIVLSNELITNGDFATDSDWTKGTGWSIANGKALYDGLNGTQQIFSSTGNRPIVGKTYKITFNVLTQGGGNNTASFGGVVFSNTNLSVDSYEFYVTAVSTGRFGIFGRNGDVFSIDNVSVKEALDADFDFTRNSSATRVNSQGLIEDMQILSGDLISNGDFSQEGSEVITNGDFSNGSTDWSNPDNAATFSNDSVTISGGSGNRRIAQANVTSPTSAQWKLQYEITEKVGSSDLKLYTTNSGTAEYTVVPSAVGVHTFYFNSNLSTFYFNFSNSTGSITIDNVSVKEVGQDWTLLNDVTSFSFENGIANIQGTANSANNGIKQDQISSVIGKTYKISATLRSNDGGLYRFRLLDGSYFDLGSGNSSEFETITSYHTATSTAFTILATSWYTSGTANFDISNISVIEITDDTNLPRIDYTGGEGHWLFEPQSTNLISYSEDYSNSFYVKDSGVSVGTTNNSSPSINANATKIDVTNNGRIYANIATNTYYTTVFIKSGTFSHFKFAGSNIDLIAETNSNGTIQSFGNGWYRIGKSYTGNRPFQIQAYPDGTYSSHTTSGNYFIWGAQSEVQSFATSYIPTSGSTVTRLADAAFGAGSSDLINSTEGVLYAEIAALADDGTNKIICLFKDGDTANRINIFYTSGSNKMKFVVRISNTNVFNTTITLSDIANYNKVALSFKENEFKVYINGVKEAEQLSGSIYPINTLDKLNFDQGGGAYPFYGKTKCVAVYKEALTDAELTCLTTI